MTLRHAQNASTLLGLRERPEQDPSRFGRRSDHEPADAGSLQSTDHGARLDAMTGDDGKGTHHYEYWRRGGVRFLGGLRGGKTQLLAGREHFRVFDESVSVVVVDGLKVFRLNFVPEDGLFPVGAHGDVSNEIFHKDGVVVGAFGDCFFVGTFEHTIELTRCGLFDELDKVLDPDWWVGTHGEGNLASLVVCTAFADGLGAGAQSRDGDNDGGNEVEHATFKGGVEADVVVEQSPLASHGR